MSFRLEIGGRHYEMSSFSVQESATPLAAGDSSGSVGSMSITIPHPDPEINPSHPVNKVGASYLIGKSVRLSDSRKGFTVGSVDSVRRDLQTASIEVSVLSRLGSLNVYNIQAQPFTGSLSNAFTYYMSLAGIVDDFLVDPEIATTPVVFPGWNGELWFNLKQMAAALDCDISLVSGVLLLRPIRKRVATRGRDVTRSVSVGGGALSQFVEVYQYNNRAIDNELVYPPGGWSEDVTVLNVNAGETIEEVLELSASVSSVSQPEMQTFVSRDYDTSSVFTVVGDDGLPIPPSAWADNGGRLEVEINPDTVSLTIRVTAPKRLPNADGSPISVYGISLSSESGVGRYSTLRIVGSGVAFDKQPVRIPTGLTEQETATEVGVTIDNPFLSEANEVYRTGIRAVRAYNGSNLNISGSVTAINRLGDTGGVQLRAYDYDQTLNSGRTYAQVQTSYLGLSYLQVQNDLNSGIDEDYENQVFGNLGGARVWDEVSARWYRIRSGTLSPSTMQFEAEDDLTHLDVQTHYTSEALPLDLTYELMQEVYSGLSYRDVDLMGLKTPDILEDVEVVFPSLDTFPSEDIYPVGA